MLRDDRILNIHNSVLIFSVTQDYCGPISTRVIARHAEDGIPAIIDRSPSLVKGLGHEGVQNIIQLGTTGKDGAALSFTQFWILTTLTAVGSLMPLAP